jgi:GntR family transcriptional repressor for pyruvate dehydrogenase complex
VSAQRRSPRMADVVADSLRSQILSGRLVDGASVPKQEELVAKFRVSPPSIREGLRILETEGLISIVRGNVGGAIVHAPRADGVAYMTALVLESQGAYLDDVYAAIRAIEPICGAMAAARKDRVRAVIPRLRKSINAQRDAHEKGDAGRFFLTARSFHTDLVACSGNRTVSLMVGALESIWAAHVAQLDTDDPSALGVYAEDAEHSRTLAEHQHILEAIQRGDSSGVEKLVRDHLVDAERHPLLGGRQPVKAAPMRES